MELYRTIAPDDHFSCNFFLMSRTNVKEAAEALAIGQSIGNPSVRSKYETPEMMENHSAKIIADPDDLANIKAGVVEIAWPYRNIDWYADGIAQLMCTVMGGQMDIDIIQQCHWIDIHINRLKGRIAFDSFTVEGYYEYERLLKINRELEPSNIYLDMDEAWLYLLGIWLGLSENIGKDANEAHSLTLNVVKMDPEYAYASNLAALLESEYLGDTETACKRLNKLEQISKDASNIEMVASRARICGKYDNSLKLYAKVFKMAPYMGLWVNKDYAATFLMEAFDKKTENYSAAKNFINFQLSENHSEEGINEMWLMMLTYIAVKEGKQNLALEYFNKQSQMEFPVTKETINNSYYTGKENDAFFNDYLETLESIGMLEK